MLNEQVEGYDRVRAQADLERRTAMITMRDAAKLSAVIVFRKGSAIQRSRSTAPSGPTTGSCAGPAEPVSAL
jgi:hypothetical protein